jgi:membrane associated rhomboid family serine protease
MMLYDRSYMKNRFSGSDKMGSEVLIFVLIVSFVLQAFCSLISSDIESKIFDYFSFSIAIIESFYIWTPFSYALLHDGPVHLIMNLIGLFFIGKAVENDIGKTNFFWLAGISSVVGASLWLFFNNNGEVLIGASAIVMSFLACFCLRNPNQEITLLLFFILPCRLKPKWIILGVLGVEIYGFIFSELQGATGIAHSAHLGGMMSGAFVYSFLKSGRYFPSYVFKFSSNFSNKTFGSFKRNKVIKSNFKVNLSSSTDIQVEVDRILDKINDQGFGALTEKEKQLLEKAKGLLKN